MFQPNNFPQTFLDRRRILLNKLDLPRLSIVVTERCTLKCKLCAEYSPYYKPQPHYTLKEVETFLDEIFSIVDEVGDLSFSGGEPLLHQDLWSMIAYASKYSNRINRLLILTNGTIVPNRIYLLELQKYHSKIWNKLRFHISDYGPALSANADNLCQLCEELCIDYRRICYHGQDMFHGGWVDYGDHSKKYHTLDEVKDHAIKCAFRKDIFFVASSCSYVSRCNRATYRKYLGILPENTSDIVDIYSNVSLTEKRNQIQRLKEAKFSESCAYCNGLCDDSIRFPPAEQIK